jgi:murein DD-endopeptidase MepM/ murein hydrolase activator NlpD
MSLLRTPTERLRRLGGWAWPSVFAAALLLVLLFALALLAPTTEATTTTQGQTLRQQLAQRQAALKQATSQLNALQDELNQLAEQRNAIEVRLAELEEEIRGTESDIAKSEKDLKAVRTQLEERLVGLYKESSSSTSPYVEILLTETDLVSVLERFDTLSEIAKQDQKMFDEVKGYLDASRASKQLLEDKQAEQAADMEELTEVEDQASDKLASADAQYRALKGQISALRADIRKADAAAAAAAEAARKRAIQQKAWREGRSWNNSGNGTMQAPPFTFPVKGAHSFINSWGFARSGGRRHKGCDVMAANGTPLVACVNGIINGANRIERGLGGITVHLKGNNGYIYYYAHLDSVAAGIQVGTAVKAGQTIGYVGHTGNAGRCNHLHFGMQPGGGASVNPYATLKFYDD